MGTEKKTRKAKISSQMQVRIPRDLYKKYGFESEAEVVETETGIEFRPIKSAGDLAADLLAKLMEQGLSGDELVEQFRKNADSAIDSVSYQTIEHGE